MPTSPDASDYGIRVAAEHKAFHDNVAVHDLPGIYHYWSEKWVLPRLRAFGIAGAAEMFEIYLAGQCSRPGNRPRKFISLGAGNCDLEVDLAQRLRGRGFDRFTIECLELNPAMLERGRAAAEQANVAEHLALVEADINQWRAQRSYDAVMASQSLHHVVNLEGLFEQVRGALSPGGQFVVSDIIGRNGHMRWPEALEIVNRFWEELPPAYRYNRPLQRQEETYENWDCSSEGFEGIRAQDVLPLLLKNFHFEFFFAFANVILPFVDRAFGHNFNPDGEWDREFIDRVHLCDHSEMLAGRIKPTIMMAVLGNDPAVPTQYFAPFSPSFCLRSTSDGQPTASPNAWFEDGGTENAELKRKIELAANSRWLRLGRRLGLGPKLR